jgi:hypothetical protein
VTAVPYGQLCIRLPASRRVSSIRAGNAVTVGWPNHGRTRPLGVWSQSVQLGDTTAGGKRLFLRLGRVEVIAKVKLNGKAFGNVWKFPYRLDITRDRQDSGMVRPGQAQAPEPAGHFRHVEVVQQRRPAAGIRAARARAAANGDAAKTRPLIRVVLLGENERVRLVTIGRGPPERSQFNRQ